MTTQTVIKGSAPTMSVVYNAATNRQTGDTADANRNVGSGYVYDVANRLLQASGTTMQYAYAPWLLQQGGISQYFTAPPKSVGWGVPIYGNANAQLFLDYGI